MGYNRNSSLCAAFKTGCKTVEEYYSKVESGLHWCSYHKQWEPRENFHADGSKTSGVTNMCKEGISVKNKKLRWKREEELLYKLKKYQEMVYTTEELKNYVYNNKFVGPTTLNFLLQNLFACAELAAAKEEETK